MLIGSHPLLWQQAIFQKWMDVALPERHDQIEKHIQHLQARVNAVYMSVIGICLSC